MFQLTTLKSCPKLSFLAQSNGGVIAGVPCCLLVQLRSQMLGALLMKCCL